MPFAGFGKNAGVTKLAEEAKYVGALTAATAQTGWASVNSSELEKTAHGLETGYLIVFTSISGGAGLVVGRPYYVEKVSANKIKLGQVSGTYNQTWTTEVTAATTKKLTEVSGGSYARIATGFGAASKGEIKDTTAREVSIPAVTTVNFLGTWTASSSGSLVSISEITEETFSNAGILKVTESLFDLLGVA